MSTFIKGETVYLRALTVDDATPEYQGWLNDSEITRHLETGRFPVSIESVRSFIETHNGSNDSLLLGIFLNDSEQHVGNVKLSPINWVHRWAELGIMIGSKAAQGKGIGTEVMQLVCQHAFDRLNLNRVSLGVIESNAAAIRCYESQFIQGRSPTFLDQFRDDAAHWGRTIGVEYGEPFAAREPLGLRSMSTLF